MLIWKEQFQEMTKDRVHFQPWNCHMLSSCPLGPAFGSWEIVYCKSLLCSMFNEQTCTRFTRLLFVTMPKIAFMPIYIDFEHWCQYISCSPDQTRLSFQRSKSLLVDFRLLHCPPRFINTGITNCPVCPNTSLGMDQWWEMDIIAKSSSTSTIYLICDMCRKSDTIQILHWPLSPELAFSAPEIQIEEELRRVINHCEGDRSSGHSESCLLQKLGHDASRNWAKVEFTSCQETAVQKLHNKAM